MSWVDKVKSLPNKIAEGSCESVKVNAKKVAMLFAMGALSYADVQAQNVVGEINLRTGEVTRYDKPQSMNRVSAKKVQDMTPEEKQRLEDERTAANNAISLKSAQDRIENAKRQAIRESQYEAQRAVTVQLEDVRTIKNDTYSTLGTIESMMRAFVNIGRR